MPRRRGPRSGRPGVFRFNNDRGGSESGDSMCCLADSDDPSVCSWCRKDFSAILTATCGHQFCKHCVEDVVLPISACPIDKRFIREGRLVDFLVSESHEDGPLDVESVSQLKRRVDSLTLIVNRLVEHLAVKNLLNEHRLSGKESAQPTNVPQTIPLISDSDTENVPNSEDMEKTKYVAKQTKAFNASNLLLLCDLPSSNGDTNPMAGNTLITSENVRELLPRFWKRATDQRWSDEEKVQRLRPICDLALQRLLDSADLHRKDWSYISSLLYGDHILDEVNMHRCLLSLRQKACETPHQWYLRVCNLVERGLPPGPQQEWEIRSAFVRGLHPKYHQALGPGALKSMSEILEKCSHIDTQVATSRPNPFGPSGVTTRRTCYSCGDPDHLARDCPKHAGNRRDRLHFII